MKNKSFQMWCLVATGKIGFPPDRKVVRAELEQHMQDHYEALIEQGHSPEDATKMTIQAMGDAYQIAPQLAAIHKPFWGYALRVCRIALIVMLCLCIFPVWNYFSGLEFSVRRYRDFEIFDATSYGGDTGRTLHHISTPETSFFSDGNTFTLTDAVVFTETLSGGTERTELYFRIEQFSWIPWTVQKDYFGTFPTFSNIGSLLYAVDSFGNRYDSFQDRSENAPHVQPNGGQTGIFTYTHECWINGFPADAQWVDICYTRDGRDFRLRVNLTGGDGK